MKVSIACIHHHDCYQSWAIFMVLLNSAGRSPVSHIAAFGCQLAGYRGHDGCLWQATWYNTQLVGGARALRVCWCAEVSEERHQATLTTLP
mmetsp:Transcript_95431/g.189140  ORF Transcript_95431/g.189140 Transcript_95431/m.189140 type:complete len:91 (-) Transcript_95431:240-512(-)